MNARTIPDFWFEPRPWIDGAWRSGGAAADVVNPATAVRLATVERADAAAVTRAVEGAARAFDGTHCGRSYWRRHLRPWVLGGRFIGGGVSSGQQLPGH